MAEPRRGRLGPVHERHHGQGRRALGLG
jgi:hypothetical protein